MGRIHALRGGKRFGHEPAAAAASKQSGFISSVPLKIKSFTPIRVSLVTTETAMVFVRGAPKGWSCKTVVFCVDPQANQL